MEKQMRSNLNTEPLPKLMAWHLTACESKLWTVAPVLSLCSRILSIYYFLPNSISSYLSVSQVPGSMYLYQLLALTFRTPFGFFWFLRCQLSSRFLSFCYRLPLLYLLTFPKRNFPLLLQPCGTPLDIASCLTSWKSSVQG